jgi:ABC-2 type transport system ATP-binding protein
LSDCTLDVPAGRVVGLVGPNGAGKTTLLHLAVGLLTPTAGTIEVLGDRPASGAAQLAKVGFVAQDAPTYAGLSVEDHLRLGARLNPGWDDALARSRIERLGLDLTQRAGKLSGGQRAQLALTLGVAKRPELLILDEPVASLDPLAGREFLPDLMEAVAEHELSVVLSSHLVSDLERVCDHLIVLVASRVQLAGDLDTLLATHHRLTGARRDPATLPADQHVIAASHTHRQTTLLVRTDAPIHARLDRRPARPGGPRPCLHGPDRGQPQPPTRAGGTPMIWLTWRQFRAAGAMMAAALAVLAVILALTGPGLADDYSTGIAACTNQSGGCSEFVHQFFKTTGTPSSPSPPSCWSCPP